MMQLGGDFPATHHEKSHGVFREAALWRAFAASVFLVCLVVLSSDGHAAGLTDKERWKEFGRELGEKGGEALKEGAGRLKGFGDSLRNATKTEKGNTLERVSEKTKEAAGVAGALLDGLAGAIGDDADPLNPDALIPRPPRKEFRRLFIHNRCHHKIVVYFDHIGRQMTDSWTPARSGELFAMWEEGAYIINVNMAAENDPSVTRHDVNLMMKKVVPEVWNFGSGSVKTWVATACPEESPIYGPGSEPAGLPKGDAPVTYHIVLTQVPGSGDHRYIIKNSPYWVFYQDRLVQRGRTGKEDGVIALSVDPALKGRISIELAGNYWSSECNLKELRPVTPDFVGPSIILPKEEGKP